MSAIQKFKPTFGPGTQNHSFPELGILGPIQQAIEKTK
jgi:hypothetical protein